MGRYLFGVISGICLLAGAFFLYFITGMAPAAATAKPMPFERLLAKDALHAAVEQGAPKTVPIQPTTANLVAGAQVYAHDCVFCHGMPGTQPSLEGRGMFPHAPLLLDPHHVIDDPATEIFWKVKNGIRLTGMPSFESFLTDQQIWQVSLLLRSADKLPPEVSAVFAPAPATQPAKPATPSKHRQR